VTPESPAAPAPELGTLRRPSPRFLAAWAAGVLLVGLLLFTYRYLEDVSSGDDVSPLEPLINELTAALGGGLVFFGWRALVARAPLGASSWPARLPLYLALWLAFSALHTSWNWLWRALLYPLAGLGTFDYGRMPMRYLMELPADTILSVTMVAGLTVAARMRSARERELRQERLEARLSEARLEALRLRLQPHFLFNALHAISATMYTDVEAADRMLERLANLLRASLRTGEDGASLVTLAAELELLEDYLALLRARFGERLTIELELEPGLGDALVPSLLLQPLVENCVQHGDVEGRGQGRVRVRAARAGAELVLSVEDDGPGPARADAAGSVEGLGLSVTRERLRLHLGAAATLRTGRGGLGGFQVTLRLPLLRAGERGEACAS